MNIKSLYSDKNIIDYEQVKNLLISEPYKISVKYDNDLYRLYSNKLFDERAEYDIFRECSGIIFDRKEVDKIVCYCMNNSEEIKIIDNNDINETIKNIKFINITDWDKIKIYKLYDGSMVRLYYHNDKWNVATTKCIDASKAKWGSSKSFYELFTECIHDINIYEHLDKNKCYSFIILHPENKIVVEHTKPSIIHVSTRDLTTLDECEEKVGIEHPESFKFDSLPDLVNYCSEQDHNFPGFMLIDENLNRLRVISPNYNNVKSLRGNVMNIKTRLLELRKKNNYELESFLKYYPEYIEMMECIEKQLLNIANGIYIKYIQRRVYKQKVELNSSESHVHFLVHGLYLRTRKKVSFDDVLMVINSLPIYKIEFLLLQK